MSYIHAPDDLVWKYVSWKDEPEDDAKRDAQTACLAQMIEFYIGAESERRIWASSTAERGGEEAVEKAQRAYIEADAAYWKATGIMCRENPAAVSQEAHAVANRARMRRDRAKKHRDEALWCSWYSMRRKEDGRKAVVLLTELLFELETVVMGDFLWEKPTTWFVRATAKSWLWTRHKLWWEFNLYGRAFVQHIPGAIQGFVDRVLEETDRERGAFNLDKAAASAYQWHRNTLGAIFRVISRAFRNLEDFVPADKLGRYRHSMERLVEIGRDKRLQDLTDDSDRYLGPESDSEYYPKGEEKALDAIEKHLNNLICSLFNELKVLVSYTKFYPILS